MYSQIYVGEIISFNNNKCIYRRSIPARGREKREKFGNPPALEGDLALQETQVLIFLFKAPELWWKIHSKDWQTANFFPEISINKSWIIYQETIQNQYFTFTKHHNTSSLVSFHRDVCSVLFFEERFQNQKFLINDLKVFGTSFLLKIMKSF